MAHVRPLGAPLSRLATCAFAASRPEAQRLASVPYQSVRCASQATKAGAKKKKARNTFLQHDLKHAEQFSLVDAMQYVHAILTLSTF
jgi:large subunit ribosomal protein L1